MISMAFIYFILFGPVIGGVLGFIINIITKRRNTSSISRSYTYSSMELEMKNHNTRMEQMMMEQHRTMIENESRRVSDSINRPLSEQFDTRLTNIFRNPWDGIL